MSGIVKRVILDLYIGLNIVLVLHIFVFITCHPV